MLRVGATAPAIDAATSNGARFVLSEQKGLCTVLYFFPKAFTPGCTAETKLFRVNYNELRLAGAGVVGISTDDARTQCSFAQQLRAPFPMIPDTDQAISRAYDVLYPLVGLARRVTYVVGPDRRIEAAYNHLLDVKRHRDQVLNFVNAKFRRTRGRG